MKKIIFIMLLVTLSLSACHVTKIKVSENVKGGSPVDEPNLDKWEDFFIFGIVPNNNTNGASICKNSGGVGFVETRRSFLNKLVGWLLYYLYTPSTTKIYCVNE